MTLLVRRHTLERRAREAGTRLLFYGRRKTGKSFFVREFTEWDEYFVVGKYGKVWDVKKKKSMEVSTFLELFPRLGGRIVIDEFHRLPGEFLDMVQALEPRELTLISSTMHLVRKIFREDSPITGFFDLIQVGLISPLDILPELSAHFEGKELVERATYYREPILLRYPANIPLERVLTSSLSNVELISYEIFDEEEKILTDVYRTILYETTQGTVKFSDIVNVVRGRFGVVQAGYHVKELIKMGFLRRVPVLGRRRKFLYKHSSPLFDLYYYLDKKYGISEEGVVPLEAIRERIPLHVEWFVEEYFSELWGLRPVKILRPEVDVALVRFKKLVFLGEVKWKGEVTKKEVREIEEKFGEVEKKHGEVERKVLVVPEVEGAPETELEVWDVERMVRGAEKVNSKSRSF